MHYLLLIHDVEANFAKMPQADIQQMMADYGKFSEQLKQAGAYVTGQRLRPISTATTIRVRNGETLATDGPFAETKEQLGGFYLIQAADLDEAMTWAAKIPSAKTGSIEVRPIWE